VVAAAVETQAAPAPADEQAANGKAAEPEPHDAPTIIDPDPSRAGDAKPSDSARPRDAMRPDA
jgi:hypothetical protein